MLIEDQVIKIAINANMIKYYEDKGYEVPRYKDKKGRMAVKRGTIIEVKAEDLPHGSKVEVKARCDYCGKKYDITYGQYYRTVVNGIIKKAACWDCSELKRAESHLKTHGVKYTAQRQDVRDKFTHTMLERYGVKHANQNSEIIEKVKNKTKLSTDDVFKRFAVKDFVPLFKPSDYINDQQHLPYMCKKHPEEIYYTTINNLNKVVGCPQCKIESLSGENNYNWGGGTSNLNQYIRSKLGEWERNTMKAYDFKCAITNGRFDTIHHVYGFNLIRDEALNNLNLDIRSEINLYTQEELNSIVEECLRLHDKYGLGVPLSKDIHILFHQLYGQGDNTPEQFEEFKIRYCMGEFEDILAS